MDIQADTDIQKYRSDIIIGEWNIALNGAEPI